MSTDTLSPPSVNEARLARLAERGRVGRAVRAPATPDSKVDDVDPAMHIDVRPKVAPARAARAVTTVTPSSRNPSLTKKPRVVSSHPAAVTRIAIAGCSVAALFFGVGMMAMDSPPMSIPTTAASENPVTIASLDTLVIFQPASLPSETLEETAVSGRLDEP